MDRFWAFIRPVNPLIWLREKATPWAAKFIPRHALACAIVAGLFTLPFLAKSYPLKMVRDMIDAYDLPKHPENVYFREFRKLFPNEFFVIALQKDDLFNPVHLQTIRDITRQVEDLPDVRRVLSLGNANITVGGPEVFEVKRFLKELPADATASESLKRAATEHPLYRKNLISPDGRTAAIVAFPKVPNAGDIDFRRRVMDDVDKILTPYRTRGYEFRIAGNTAIHVHMARSSELDLNRFVGLMYLLLALSLWWLFRNPRLVGLGFLNVVLVVSCVRGLAGWLGYAINNWSVVAIPLTMALALSDTVHVFTHLDRRILSTYPDRRAALAHLLSSILYPCFLTSVNTFLGFLSLTVNRVKGLHEFAILASAGMVFEFTITFLFIVPLLLKFDPQKIYRDPEVQKERAIPAFLKRVDALVHRRPRAIVLSAALLTAVSVYLALGLEVNTNFYSFFRPSDPWRQSLEFIEKNLAGVENIEVALESDKAEAFQDPANLRVIEEIQKRLEFLPGIDLSLSLVDHLKIINKSFHNEDPTYYRIPETKPAVAQYLLLYGNEDTDDFVNSSYTRARITARSHLHNTTAQAPVIEELKRYVASLPAPGLRIHVTGEVVKDLNTSHAVIEDMISSIWTSVGSIALVMALALESWGLVVLFLVPNLFPIIINFGIMRMLGMSFNVANALIAACAFGMIVDDTVHFFTTYKAVHRKGVSWSQTVSQLIAIKGEASASSFVLLLVAFGVLLTSTYKPTFDFAALNILVLFTGIAGDQLLLNSLLIWIGQIRQAPLSRQTSTS